MDGLTPLTPEAAERFLVRLPYEQRFQMSMMGKHGGFQTVPVLSAQEFVNVAQTLKPVLSVEALSAWVSERLGDASLAVALVEACESEAIFKQVDPACALMSARIAEAKAALGSEEQAAATE